MMTSGGVINSIGKATGRLMGNQRSSLSSSGKMGKGGGNSHKVNDKKEKEKPSYQSESECESGSDSFDDCIDEWGDSDTEGKNTKTDDGENKKKETGNENKIERKDEKKIEENEGKKKETEGEKTIDKLEEKKTEKPEGNKIETNFSEDFIKDLFIQKIREYAKKQKEEGGALIDPSPETERERARQMEYLNKKYNVSNEAEFTKFPTFTFKDPILDSPNMTELDSSKKEEKKEEEDDEECDEEEETNEKKMNQKIKMK